MQITIRIQAPTDEAPNVIELLESLLRQPTWKWKADIDVEREKP
jgi:hypothetical protein